MKCSEPFSRVLMNYCDKRKAVMKTYDTKETMAYVAVFNH